MKKQIAVMMLLTLAIAFMDISALPMRYHIL